MKAPAHVFYADGHLASSHMVQATLRKLAVEFIHFDDAKGCLDSLKTRRCRLLISDARRPTLEGVALLRNAKSIAPSVPVLMMIDHGDIDTAVRAMKSGAVDCLERPPEQKHLLAVLDAALQASVQNTLPKMASLSPTEKRVLHLILQGQTTAETARTLHRSRRTIEVHRNHIIRKLQADGMVDLVRKCARLGLLEDWP